jgi:hypothetical protein
LPMMRSAPTTVIIGVADDFTMGPNAHAITALQPNELRARIHQLEDLIPQHAWIQHPAYFQNANQVVGANLTIELNHLRALLSAREKYRYVLRVEHYQKMIEITSTFSSLSTLMFTGTVLPYQLHSLVHSLPRLKALRIKNCDPLWRDPFDKDTVTLNHAALSLEELEIDCQLTSGADDAAREVATLQLYRLVEARSLHKLTLRWMPTAMSKWMDRMFELGALPIARLDEFHIILDHFVAWPSPLKDVLIYFLRWHPGIKTLHIDTQQDASALVGVPGILPSLTCVRGRDNVAGVAGYGRKLQEIYVTACEQPYMLIHQLQSNDHSALTRLAVHSRNFEDELLIAGCKFPTLIWLSLTFQDGRPSEVSHGVSSLSFGDYDGF